MKQMSDLPDKDLRIMVVEMLTEPRRRIKEHTENFNKDKI